MQENDNNYTLDDDFKLVRLINGEKMYVSDPKLVGYCHYKLHKGYISLNILKDHRCVKKDCPFLEKFEDHAYWITEKRIKKAVEKHKQEIKDILRFKKERERQLEIHINDMYEEISILAHEMNFDIIVCSVRKIDSNKYIIFYVSDNTYDDHLNYVLLARTARYLFSEWFILKHIKLPDGRYASKSDWLRLKKDR